MSFAPRQALMKDDTTPLHRTHCTLANIRLGRDTELEHVFTLLLPVVVTSALRYATEGSKYMCMRIKQHLMTLHRISDKS